MKVSYSRTFVLVGVLTGLIGCSVGAPGSAPRSTGGNAAAPNLTANPSRHVLDLANPAATLAELREALPAEISAADAARLLVRIDPSQVVSEGRHFGLQAMTTHTPTGQAPWKPVTSGHASGTHSPSPMPSTRPSARPSRDPIDSFLDNVILSYGFSPFYSNSILSNYLYYPYGNYMYPYYNYGGSYYPYTYATNYDYLSGLGYGGLYGGLGTYSPYSSYDFLGNGYGYPYYGNSYYGNSGYGSSSYGYTGYPFLYGSGSSYYPYSFGSNSPYAYTNPAPVTAASVAIQGFAFQPNSVMVRSGGSVTWNNLDPLTHSVTPDVATSGMTWPGDIASGQSRAMTFTTPGYYAYHCRFHPEMRGLVVVQ